MAAAAAPSTTAAPAPALVIPPAALEQLGKSLENAINPDGATRTAGHQALKGMEASNLPLYLAALAAEMGNEKKPAEARQLAGLLLKNAMFAKDPTERAALQKRWAGVHEGVRKQIKTITLQTLGSPVKPARSSAAVVTATIASIEVPLKLWPELVQSLITNIATATTPEAKQASYEALGYVCEECPEDLEQQAGAANMILNAIQAGMDKGQSNNAIKLAATVALRNALEFTRSNFTRPAECKLIFTMVFDAAASDNAPVRTAALSCLVAIAEQYYQYLKDYITQAYQLTSVAIKAADPEPVALQAIEFWSTICDVETEIMEEHEEEKQLAASQGRQPQPGRPMFKFMATAAPQIVPLILNCLTKQSDDPDDETWNVAMAAGASLALIAQTAGDVMVGPVLPFVQANLRSAQWRQREAATLAFGSILQGPSKAGLTKLIKQALPVILDHFKDQQPIVKDTAAWTVGRICNLIPEAVEESLPTLMQAFSLGLSDKNPKVAANVCWAIHNLAEAVNHDGTTSPLSRYFELLMKALLVTSERPDSSSTNLRGSAYEAINVMIHKAAKDVYGLIGQLIPTLMERLRRSFLIPGMDADEKAKQNEVQALLCGSLQVIVQKLDSAVVIKHADNLMSLFLTVLSSKNASTVHEEALMAISAIANLVGADFLKYMQAFKPHLLAGLKSIQEQHVLTVAAGVVGDVSRALEAKVAPYCDEMMQLLLQNLQSPQVDRNVKPHIIGAISDIALAVGGNFDRYLKWVMQFLVQASQTTFPPEQMDAENVEYLATLRESVLEAYTGILTGMGGDGKANLLVGYLEPMVAFLDALSKDLGKPAEVLKAAIGVIGDLASQVGAPVAPMLRHGCIQALIQQGGKSGDEPTVKAAQWSMTEVEKLLRGSM